MKHNITTNGRIPGAMSSVLGRIALGFVLASMVLFFVCASADAGSPAAAIHPSACVVAHPLTASMPSTTPVWKGYERKSLLADVAILDRPISDTQVAAWKAELYSYRAAYPPPPPEAGSTYPPTPSLKGRGVNEGEALTPSPFQGEGRGEVLPSASFQSEVPASSPAQGDVPPVVTPVRAAWLHIWLGEYALAHDEQPELCRWHCRMAKALTQPLRYSSRDAAEAYGLAAFDDAIATYYSGAYQAAVDAFTPLASARTSLAGYDLRLAACWLRHAVACAGYHRQRSLAGIPEPTRLDPFCGAAALATALRALRLPYARPIVAAACRVTGEGSTLADIIAAGQKLGVDVIPVTADEIGLKDLPKPLVAHVERDHFVAVVAADATGVSYLCSDCGCWPGGRVHLTWKQWRMMAGGVYGVVVKPGTAWSHQLADLPLPGTAPAVSPRYRPLRVAYDGLDVFREMPMVQMPAWNGHVFRTQTAGYVFCSSQPNSPHCPPPVGCPMDGGPGHPKGPQHCGCQQGTGPSVGEPVNLATGEEEYTPPADLTVYNSGGPSVVWSRTYDSLRQAGAGYTSAGDATYQCDDYGIGWSQSYNVGVWAYNGDSAANTVDDIYEPNGSRISFTTPVTAPSGGTPAVQCAVQPGNPVLVEWDYDGGATYHFTITFADRTKWITGTTSTTQYGDNSGVMYPVVQIEDRNGNSIYLNYTSSPRTGWPLISSITTASGGGGTQLLTVNRAGDSSGNITSIADCYGRSVYYNVGKYPDSYQSPELDHVSQIVSSCTVNPPDRYAYGYTMFTAGGGLEPTNQFSLLHTITVPSPTGSGTSTDVINYDPNTAFVSSFIDANGNKRVYYSSDQYGTAYANTDYTTVKAYNSSGTLQYQYTVGFDIVMDETSSTDGNDNPTYTSTFGDSNDPYRSSSVEDGNGNTWSYSWDQYGNIVTWTTPRGVTYTNTFDYSNFAMGELVQTQEATSSSAKTPANFTYYEPSGLLETVNAPTPGTVDTGSQVTTSVTYDSLGNVLTITTPGNNSVGSKLTTLNYTSDPGDSPHGVSSHSQSAAIGQPLTITDNLGNVTHLRYDSQGNLTTAIDALGNEYDNTYNLANQPTESQFPATGEQGAYRGYVLGDYQYVGGAMADAKLYDEAGTKIREIDYSYGPEDETLGVSGNTQPATYTYDALYRILTLTDGNSHTTDYAYNTQGYLASVTYPGTDEVQFPSYDKDGNPLERIDGRGIETDYTYDDPESFLTKINYVSHTSEDVYLGYDGFGRLSGMADATEGNSSTPGVVYSYDNNDGVTGIATTYSGISGYGAQTISYDYYPDGSRSEMTTPAGSTLYDYDGDGRMTSLTNPYSETSSWTYLNNNWLASQELANGVTTTYTLNAQGMLTDLSTKNSSSTLLSEFSVPTSAGYDGAMNALSVTASVPGYSTYGGTTDYTYDTKNQLLEEASTRNGSFTNYFAYDSGSGSGVGNPSTMRGNTYTFNSDNQITNSGFSYDGEGNPTTYGGTSLTFDVEDRMTAYGSAMSAGYDGFGRRAWKENTGGTTYFLYDGMEPVCELNSSGSLTAVNTFGANGLLSRRVSSTSTFYTFDNQGGAVQRLDSGGSNVDTNQFDAFGNRIASTDSSTDPFSGYGAQWGYYTDSETGLELTGFRYYDPAVGRFINRDPISYNGGMNLYGYATNNPVSRVDPTGLACKILIPKQQNDPLVQPYHHEYIQFNSGDHASYGFYPTGSGIPWNVPGQVSVNIDNGLINEANPKGQIQAENDDPAFDAILRNLIKKSQAHPPHYSIEPGKYYVCGSWADQMWNEATDEWENQLFNGGIIEPNGELYTDPTAGLSGE